MQKLATLVTTLAVMSVCSAPAFSQDAVGKVVAISGDVNARNAKMFVRVLQNDAEIFADDTILTHGGARVEIRMADGGSVVLESNKQFKLAEYDSVKSAAAAASPSAAGGAALSPSAAP